MKKFFKTITIISIFLLLSAILPLPYGYYMFLRLVIFICSLILAYNFYKFNSQYWAVIFGLISLIFNPIIPIYLDKKMWISIDIISAGLFFFSLESIKKIDKKIEPIKCDGLYKSQKWRNI